MIAKTISIRERLLSVIDRVPRSIAASGHGAAVAYKDWIVKARPKASNSRTTDAELQSLLSQWEVMDRERLL